MINDSQLNKLLGAMRDPKRAAGSAPKLPPPPNPVKVDPGIRRLGKYLLTERLAPNTWKATEEGRSSPLVLRVLGGAPAGTEMKTLSEELIALSKVKNPLLVTYHKISAIEGVYFIVRDFAEGRPLSTAEFKDPIRFLRFYAEVAGIVGQLHAGGVTHGDLTPPNIIVGPGNMPILVDVGMLRIKNHFRADGSTILQESPDRDIMALGELFWVMMSGKGIPDPMGELPALRPIEPLVDADIAMFAFRFMRSSAQPFNSAAEIRSTLSTAIAGIKS